MQRTDYTLKIDPEFRRLVLPLTSVEQEALEEILFSPGRNHRVLVWHNTLLVDYTYYEYCEMLQLPYEAVSIPCVSMEEVIAWICKNQLERQELTIEMRRYLIGKLSAAELALLSAKPRTPGGRPEFGNSQFAARSKISKEYGIAPTSVLKYENYAKSLDSMRKTVPETIEAHLAGRFKISLDRAVAMAQLSPEKLREECQHIIAEVQLDTPTTWKKRLLPQKNQTRADAKKKPTIKDMPKYDPDAEISSLTLTIPSWISTINRVNSVTDIDLTTPEARARLRESLKLLKRTANTLLRKTKED